MREEGELPAGPEVPGGAAGPGAQVGAPSYSRLASLARWISWLLLGAAALYAASAVVTLAVHGLGKYSTPARLDRLGGTDVALSTVGVMQSAIFIATAVLFLIWFYRAYENLRAVAAPPPRRGSGWTIGAWFVPVLDLILPKLMLDEVWRGSEPDARRDSAAVRIPAFHHLWWWTWVVAFLLSTALGVESAISSVQSALAGDVTGTSVSGALVILTSALHGVAAVLGALVVRQTTERQESRWQRLSAARP